MALSVPLSRFTSQVGGGSAFFVRPHASTKYNMKTKYMIKTITLTIALFTALVLRSNAASPESEAQFIANAKAAFDTKDSGQLLKLMCWDGVAPEEKNKINLPMSVLVKRPVKQIELVAPPDPQKLEYTRDGVTYRPNLVVIKLLMVTFKSDKTADVSTPITFPVGEKDGKLFIATAAPVK